MCGNTCAGHPPYGRMLQKRAKGLNLICSRKNEQSESVLEGGGVTKWKVESGNWKVFLKPDPCFPRRFSSFRASLGELCRTRMQNSDAGRGTSSRVRLRLNYESKRFSLRMLLLFLPHRDIELSPTQFEKYSMKSRLAA